jgi:hypothetical protein
MTYKRYWLYKNYNECVTARDEEPAGMLGPRPLYIWTTLTGEFFFCEDDYREFALHQQSRVEEEYQRTLKSFSAIFAERAKHDAKQSSQGE